MSLGDIVCGQAHHSNPADQGTGSFAKYVRARVDLVLRVPDAVAPTAAATMGTQLPTSCLSLWGSPWLPASFAQPVEGGGGGPVLVYGGSTTEGSLAIQLLRLAYTKGRLRQALDCITDQASVACCYAAHGRPGGRHVSLERCASKWRTREAVKAEFVLMYETFGRKVALEGVYRRAKNPQAHRLARNMYRVMQALLDGAKTRRTRLGWSGVAWSMRLS